MSVSIASLLGREGAILNQRADGKAVKEGAQKEIGGNERFIALCRKHSYERLSE